MQLHDNSDRMIANIRQIPMLTENNDLVTNKILTTKSTWRRQTSTKEQIFPVVTFFIAKTHTIWI